MTAPLVPCANCAVLRGALDESRGQVRTLRLTLDQGVGELVAMQAERDALRAAVRAERRAVAEYAAAIDMGDVAEARAWRQRRIETERALLALLPPEAP